MPHRPHAVTHAHLLSCGNTHIADVGQLTSFEERAAHRRIRPGSILQPANVDSLPVSARRECRGEDLNRIVAFAARCKGIHGKVLGIDIVKEQLSGGTGHLVDETSSRLKKPYHGVKISMRPLGFRPGLRAFGHPNFFESACLPQRPKYGFGVGAAFGESLMPGGKYTCHAAYRRTNALRRKCLRVQEGAQQKIVATAVPARSQFCGAKLLT